jgi:hypothetical protein
MDNWIKDKVKKLKKWVKNHQNPGVQNISFFTHKNKESFLTFLTF